MAPPVGHFPSCFTVEAVVTLEGIQEHLLTKLDSAALLLSNASILTSFSSNGVPSLRAERLQCAASVPEQKSTHSGGTEKRR